MKKAATWRDDAVKEGRRHGESGGLEAKGFERVRFLRFFVFNLLI